jgi:hypothetical protein
MTLRVTIAGGLVKILGIKASSPSQIGTRKRARSPMIFGLD